MTVNDLRRKCVAFCAQRDHARKTLSDERSAIWRERRRVSRVLKAQEILQTVAQGIQQQAHKQIATVVSRCLKAVFQNPYKFRIKFERKRGKTEAKLVFVRNRMELDPVDGSGGGVLDVAAFALRLACLLLQKPHRRKLLVLDEPFRFLSERLDYREKVRTLLETLSEEMGVQMVIVTHDRALEAGKVIELT